MICNFWSAGDVRVQGCQGWYISEGIKSLGFTVSQHYPTLLDPDNLPHADVVVSNGFRWYCANPAKVMEQKGVPVIVYDLGYLDRASLNKPEGYSQIGLGRIGWVPSFDCPSDRFDNLGITVTPLENRDTKDVLVCAQKSGDAQHGMGMQQMVNFITEVCEDLKAQGYNPIVRAHPMEPCFEIEGYDKSYCKVPLMEAAKQCKFIVTYNSTSGVEAVLSGTPVIAIAEDVHYRPMCSELVDGELVNPSHSTVMKQLYKTAYAQWKREEILTGLPFKFVLECHKGNNPFNQDIDWTQHQPKKVPPFMTPKEIEESFEVPRGLSREERHQWASEARAKLDSLSSEEFKEFFDSCAPKEGSVPFDDIPWSYPEEEPREEPKPSITPEDLEGLKWHEQRALVKDATGVVAKNKAHLLELINAV